MKLTDAQGKVLDFTHAKVMGIVNLTPDSFHAASRVPSPDLLLEQVDKMIEEGADIIDLGAFSSRPGAQLVKEEEELSRLIPALELIIKEFPHVILSVDTFRAKVAEEALQRNVSIINDISAFEMDPKLLEVLSKFQPIYCLMHMQNRPDNMQENPSYSNVVEEVFHFLESKMDLLKKANVSQVIVDPGFGFGKTVEHNYQLLQNLNKFQDLNSPVLVGISRKSMITKLLGISSKDALNATSALHMTALERGASILRVHDVKEAKEVIQCFLALRD